jgi:hypothetical protein
MNETVDSAVSFRLTRCVASTIETAGDLLGAFAGFLSIRRASCAALAARVGLDRGDELRAGLLGREPRDPLQGAGGGGAVGRGCASSRRARSSTLESCAWRLSSSFRCRYTAARSARAGVRAPRASSRGGRARAPAGRRPPRRRELSPGLRDDLVGASLSLGPRASRRERCSALAPRRRCGGRRGARPGGRARRPRDPRSGRGDRS